MKKQSRLFWKLKYFEKADKTIQNKNYFYRQNSSFLRSMIKINVMIEIGKGYSISKKILPWSGKMTMQRCRLGIV